MPVRSLLSLTLPLSLSLSLPLRVQVIIGAAMTAFHALNGPVNKRELIDTHSRGFDAFHQEHGLSTPATIVQPPPSSSLLYLHERRVSPEGTVTHPLLPMHTTQDPVVPLHINPHFDERAPTLNAFARHAWTEDASEWSAAYKRMLIEKYGGEGVQGAHGQGEGARGGGRGAGGRGRTGG